jgi:glycosyltransferase involved in cell wall biosynthesis
VRRTVALGWWVVVDLTKRSDSGSGPRVLHVVATGARRGGEIFASDLIGALEHREVVQHVAILRACGEPAVDFHVPVTGLTGHEAGRPASAVDPRILWGLRKTLEFQSPDVLLAHGGEPLKYSIASIVGHRVPVIYRRIGSIRGRTALRGMRLGVYRSLMRRASTVVAVADAIREETIGEFRVPRSRVVTIPNAIDADRVRPHLDRAAMRASMGIPSTAPLIVSVGALTWEKDPLAQLGVVDAVMGIRPEARFVMVGDGPLRRTVETAVRTSEYGDRIHLTGARDDVGDILAASDVLFLNSRSEGMPAILIEAGMLGLPTVASAVGGVPEVVEHGVTGLLCAPDDTTAMASSLIELLDDARRRRSLGRSARARCLARFEIRPVADRYLDILRRRSEGR